VKTLGVSGAYLSVVSYFYGIGTKVVLDVEGLFPKYPGGMTKMKATNEAKQGATSAAQLPMPDKAVKLLASSIFRHLQSEGCQPKDIICVSSQLLDLVTSELQKDAAP